MAKAKTTTPEQPVEQPQYDAIARQEIALHASGYVDSLLKMLRREADADEGNFTEILDNTLMRIQALNGVALAVLSGNDRDIDEMCVTVYGKHSDGRLEHA